MRGGPKKRVVRTTVPGFASGMDPIDAVIRHGAEAYAPSLHDTYR